MKTDIFGRKILWLVLAVFCSLAPLYGDDIPRSPIDINLIIDGSGAFTGAKDEITAWLSGRLDQILIAGDRVTVWSAGPSAKVVFTGKVDGNSSIDAIKKSIRDISASGNRADFAGALKDAAARKNSDPCYTLLVSVSQESLSALLSGGEANIMRFSRVEEFSGWRALVVGLNLDAKVQKAAAAFFGS